MLKTLPLLVAVTLPLSTLAAQAPHHLRVEHVPAGTEWIAGHGWRHGSEALPVRSRKLAFDPQGRWFERLGAPHNQFRQIWGSGVAVAPQVIKDAKAASELAETFWRDNLSLLPAGVRAADLALQSNTLGSGVRIVRHRQLLEGVPVLGGGVQLTFKHDRLVMLGIELFAAKGFDSRPTLALPRAAALAEQALAVRGEQARAGHPELAAFPRVRRDGTEFVLVYRVEARGPGGRWTAFIDARSGELVALRDERMFVGGQVELEHHDRHPGNSLVAGAAAHLRVVAGGEAAFTDLDGGFSAGPSTADVQLETTGRYVTVRDQGNSSVATTIPGMVEGETLYWQSDGSEFQQAQLDAYRFATEASEHARGFVDGLGWLDEVLQVNVNYNDVCNAWFDGELTFLRAGEQQGFRCNNSGMVADIVYHEFGHGLHIASSSRGMYGIDDAVSEGFADFFSATLTDDHNLAPYFAVGGAPLRDIEPDKVWPTDEGYDPHDTGLIVGGALWDLRKLLIDQLGEDAGRARALEIFSVVLRTTGDVPSLYEATILADDDNGDLSDGSPNACAIDLAFALHGLTSQQFGVLRVDHQQQSHVAADQPIAIEAGIAVANPECSDASVGDVRVFYAEPEATSWQVAEMQDLGNGQFRAELPARPQGTQLRYRIEAVDPASGVTVVRPSNPAEPYYLLFVGELEAIVCNDFEGETGGWDHALLAGQQIEGADDWQLGTPGGLGGDPAGAFSGTQAWGNDLSPDANWNGQYQSGKLTTLKSPVFDLSDHDQVRLQFRRWLQVEDGTYDRARVLVNDQLVWANLAADGSSHHLDSEWVLFDVDISAAAGGQSAVQIRWEIESDQGLEFGGWNIDDVCLYAVVEGRPGSGGDVLDPDADVPAGDGEDLGHTALAGCGCSSTAPAPSVALVAMLLGLLVARRRR